MSSNGPAAPAEVSARTRIVLSPAQLASLVGVAIAAALYLAAIRTDVQGLRTDAQGLRRDVQALQSGQARILIRLDRLDP